MFQNRDASKGSFCNRLACTINQLSLPKVFLSKIMIKCTTLSSSRRFIKCNVLTRPDKDLLDKRLDSIKQRAQISLSEMAIKLYTVFGNQIVFKNLSSGYRLKLLYQVQNTSFIATWLQYNQNVTNLLKTIFWSFPVNPRGNIFSWIWILPGKSNSLLLWCGTESLIGTIAKCRPPLGNHTV